MCWMFVCKIDKIYFSLSHLEGDGLIYKYKPFLMYLEKVGCGLDSTIPVCGCAIIRRIFILFRTFILLTFISS